MVDDETTDEDQDERKVDEITERAIAASHEFRGRDDLMVLAKEADAHSQACLARLRRAAENHQVDEVKAASEAQSEADDRLLAILYAMTDQDAKVFMVARGRRWEDVSRSGLTVL